MLFYLHVYIVSLVLEVHLVEHVDNEDVSIRQLDCKFLESVSVKHLDSTDNIDNLYATIAIIIEIIICTLTAIFPLPYMIELAIFTDFIEDHSAIGCGYDHSKFKDLNADDHVVLFGGVPLCFKNTMCSILSRLQIVAKFLAKHYINANFVNNDLVIARADTKEGTVSTPSVAIDSFITMHHPFNLFKSGIVHYLKLGHALFDLTVVEASVGAGQTERHTVVGEEGDLRH